MGINKFHQWLREKYSTSFSIAKYKKYDHIYIDLNHILHILIINHTNTRYFTNSLLKTLDYILITFLPTKSVTIAIDGPASFAKLLLQQKRRSKIISDKTISSKLTRNDITPGTKLMQIIDDVLENYSNRINKIVRTTQIKYTLIKSTDPDEAEIKIINRLKYNKLGDMGKYNSHLIISNDSDIIMIAMSQLNISNIHICVKSHNKNYEIIAIDTIYHTLIKKHIFNRANRIAKIDFIFLGILMGNDYLPKMQYINFDILWKAYIYLKSNISNLFEIKDNRIYFNIPNLLAYFKNLVCCLKRGIYNKFLLDIDIDITTTNSSIQCYLEGLLWCINMYHSGICSKYNYTYNYKTVYNPIYIMYYLENLLINKMSIEIPQSNSKPVPIEIYNNLAKLNK